MDQQGFSATMLEMTCLKMKAFHVELLGHACENGCSGGFPQIIGLIPKMTKDCGTFHKNHFVWKFTGKMPDPPVNTLIAFSVATLLKEQRRKKKWKSDHG